MKVTLVMSNSLEDIKIFKYRKQAIEYLKKGGLFLHKGKYIENKERELEYWYDCITVNLIDRKRKK